MKNLFIALLLLVSTACTPGRPYEIKSPCVAVEAADQAITPCVRRPVNINRAVV